jgi:acyl carrier protein
MEFEKIKENIAQILNVEPTDITMETSFTEAFGIDSLQMFQLMVGLEDVFGMQFEPNVMEKIETVSDIVSYIQEKK